MPRDGCRRRRPPCLVRRRPLIGGLAGCARIDSVQDQRYRGALPMSKRIVFLAAVALLSLGAVVPSQAEVNQINGAGATFP